MLTMSTFRSLCVPLVAFVVAAGCSDPTIPTPTPTPQAIEVFAGPLDPGGTREGLFSLEGSSTVQLMLAGVVAGNPLRALSPTLRLELATWNGSSCVTNNAIDVTPAFKARIQLYLRPGSYCAKVTDINRELTQQVFVTVRVVAPAIISLNGEPGSRVFDSNVTPHGSAATSFVASRAGRVTVSLDSVAEDVEMALALGLPGENGRGCEYGKVVHARAGSGPHIDEEVDAGHYCAAIVDIGNLKGSAPFSMTITHP
jgi:hypothetical protein